MTPAHINGSGVRNDPQPRPQNPGISLTAEEVNFMTGLLVELPYKVAAPIIKLLGEKVMEARNGRD